MLRRLLDPRFWLAALALGVTLSIPWLPRASQSPAAYTLELTLRASAQGTSQLYYDLGAGLNEEQRIPGLLRGSGASETLRFALPAGSYHGFRFDPASVALEFTLERVRLLDHRKREVALPPLSSWESWNEIATTVVSPSGITFTTLPAAADPSIWLGFTKPLVLPQTSLAAWQPVVRRIGATALVVLAVLVLGAGAWTRSARAFAEAGRVHPVRMLAAIAALATVLSSYPVVFLGKSIVSPNYGARLLYDAIPTLPGQADARLEDVKMADVGAMMWQHLPMSFVQARAWSNGELPLWNRTNSSGTLLLGQGQSMIGDPLQFLVVLAGADAWAWDLKFLAAKFLLCFGLGLLAWLPLRSLPAAGVIAFAGAFIGFFIYRINHPAYFSFCYAPWVLVAWLVLEADLDRPNQSRGLAALIAANLLLMTSGTVKEAYMLLLALNATGLTLLLSSTRAAWRARLRSVGWTVAAGGAFVLLTAPLWTTLLHALRVSYSGYQQPSAYQVHPSFLIGFFDEIFYRPIQAEERVFNPSANFIFLGGLLFLAITWRREPQSGVVVTLVTAFAAAMAMAFGVVPPDLIKLVPFLANVAHIDNCFSLIAIILAAPLAAAGWSAAGRALRGPCARGDLQAFALLLGLLLASWVAMTQTIHKPLLGWDAVFSPLKWDHRLPVGDFVWASAALLPVALLAGVILLGRCLLAERVTLLTGTGLAICAAVILWRHGQHTPTAFDPYVFNPTERASFFSPSAAVQTVRQDQSGPFRVAGTDGNFVAGWSAAYGLEGISGPDALVNPWYRELTTAFGIDRINDWRLMVRSETFLEQKPAYDFLGLRYYFNHHGSPGPWEQKLAVVTLADLDVYRSAEAWPRAFWVSGVSRYDRVSDLATNVLKGDGRPFAAVAAAEAPADWPLPDGQPAIPAHDYRLTANTTSFRLSAPQRGLAVLHETWLPDDFTATVNGLPAQVVRVNHAFKGVWLPAAGDHAVEFSYRPPRLRWALGASLVGVIAIAALLILPARRREARLPL